MSGDNGKTCGHSAGTHALSHIPVLLKFKWTLRLLPGSHAVKPLHGANGSGPMRHQTQWGGSICEPWEVSPSSPQFRLPASEMLICVRPSQPQGAPCVQARGSQEVGKRKRKGETSLGGEPPGSSERLSSALECSCTQTGAIHTTEVHS